MADNFVPNITTSRYTPQYVGAPIEEIAKAVGDTQARYTANQQGIDALESALQNVTILDKGAETKSNAIQNFRKNIKAVVDSGRYEDAQPMLRQAAKDFSGDKLLRQEMSDYQSFQAYKEQLKELEKSGDLIGADREALLNVASKGMKAATLDQYGEAQSGLSLLEPSKYVDIIDVVDKRLKGIMSDKYGGPVTTTRVDGRYIIKDTKGKTIEEVTEQRAKDLALDAIQGDKELQSYLNFKADLDYRSGNFIPYDNLKNTTDFQTFIAATGLQNTSAKNQEYAYNTALNKSNAVNNATNFGTDKYAFNREEIHNSTTMSGDSTFGIADRDEFSRFMNTSAALVGRDVSESIDNSFNAIATSNNRIKEIDKIIKQAEDDPDFYGKSADELNDLRNEKRQLNAIKSRNEGIIRKAKIGYLKSDKGETSVKAIHWLMKQIGYDKDIEEFKKTLADEDLLGIESFAANLDLSAAGTIAQGANIVSAPGVAKLLEKYVGGEVTDELVNQKIGKTSFPFGVRQGIKFLNSGYKDWAKENLKLANNDEILVGGKGSITESGSEFLKETIDANPTAFMDAYTGVDYSTMINSMTEEIIKNDDSFDENNTPNLKLDNVAIKKTSEYGDRTGIATLVDKNGKKYTKELVLGELGEQVINNMGIGMVIEGTNNKKVSMEDLQNLDQNRLRELVSYDTFRTTDNQSVKTGLEILSNNYNPGFVVRDVKNELNKKSGTTAPMIINTRYEDNNGDLQEAQLDVVVKKEYPTSGGGYVYSVYTKDNTGKHKVRLFGNNNDGRFYSLEDLKFALFYGENK